MANEPLSSVLERGTRVALRGDTWCVETRTPHADCESLKVLGCGAANAGATRTFLLPFDRPRTIDGQPRTRGMRRRAYLHAVRHLCLQAHPFGGLGTAAAARITLMPFQVEPALAVHRHGRLRVLIADEVGLGKTVQAGLIMAELLHREDAARVLVLCPAGLREQWREELSSRFSLPGTIADTAWLLHSARNLPPTVNTWSLPGIFITSLDFVKQPEILRGLEDVRWDLLVVDEVHGAGVGTARLAAAEALGATAHRVVLLTATPPEGDPAHLDRVTAIGRLGPSDDLTWFRRSRADVGVASARRTVFLSVRPTAAERRMHHLLDRYTSLIWREAGIRRDPRGRLTAIVLRKRALSSATSLLSSLRRRIALLGATDPPVSGEQLRLPLYDEDPLPDVPPDDLLAAPGLVDSAHERVLLEEVARAAEQATRGESKVRLLRRLLARAGEPMVVFTEYRDTLAHLARELRAHGPTMLHGGLTPAERAAVQRAFERQGSLMLATDAASEGLNLHHRSRAVVHFELPWTPLRLEQRTGRVDRLGQSRRVHEILLVARHTAERMVLAPLITRVRRTARTGRRSRLASLAESAVATAILERGTVAEEPPLPVASIECVGQRAEAEEECARLESHRRLGAPAVAVPRRSMAGLSVHVANRPQTEVTAFLRISLALHDGRPLHDEVVPVACRVRLRTRLRTNADAGRFASEFIACHGDAVLRAAEARLGAAREARTRALALMDALLSRAWNMAGARHDRARLVQAGLFDRRALDEAEARSQAAAALAADAESRAALRSKMIPRETTRIVAVHVGRLVRR